MNPKHIDTVSEKCYAVCRGEQELELTDDEITYLEEPYVFHALAGVMALGYRKSKNLRGKP